jgi:lysyl-tRNA synthetase, class II
MSRRSAAPEHDAPPARSSQRIDRERHRKLRQLRLQGAEPYPQANLPARSLAADLYAAHDPAAMACGEHEGLKYTVAGRLVARRKHQHATFLDVIDASGVVELCIKRERLSDPRCKQLRGADLGDIVCAEGTVYVTDNHRLTLAVTRARLLAKALRLPPVRAGAQHVAAARHRQRELDLLASERTRALFRARSALTAATRGWMEDNGFIEVQAPALRSSSRSFLRRCLVGGLERVYVLGGCLGGARNGQLDGPEHTMLEWSAAYVDSLSAARHAEALIVHAAARVAPEMRASWRGNSVELGGPWHTTTVRDCILERCGLDVHEADASELARLLAPETAGETGTWGSYVDALYAKLVQPTLIQPTVVLDLPLHGHSLAKRHPRYDRLAASFRVVVAGVEVCSGEEELNDPGEQGARLNAGDDIRGDGDVAAAPDEEVRLLEYGLCPAASASLRIDRLLMLLTGSESAREVIPFLPRGR